MDRVRKIAWYQGMALSDVASMLDARQITKLLEKKHPLNRKPHSVSQEDAEENK